MDGLSIGAGDLIQTRRNDSEVGVANRQTWIVQKVEDDGSLWVRHATSGRKRQHSVRLTAEYVAEHAHLAYASTAYGVQGVTAPDSHTVLSDALDAAGVYVGLTRGRESNRLHVVAADLGDAREQFVAALERDRADRGLSEATQRAQAAVAGLADVGPVGQVNTERARLNKQIEKAERLAAKWEQAAAAFTDLAKRHKAEEDEQAAALATAENEEHRARAEVVGPLVVEAAEEGTAVDTARSRVWEAARAKDAARGFRKRSAARVLDAATAERETLEATVRRTWGSIPVAAANVEPWVESVTSRKVDAHPRVSAQRKRVDAARKAQRELAVRHLEERRGLVHDVFGDLRPGNPREYARMWRQHADVARHDLETIEALPVTEAAQLIRDRAAQEQGRREAAERAETARKACAAKLHGFTERPSRSDPTPPSRGLGL